MHWYLIALGVGLCVAMQPTVNAALRKEVGVAPVLILGTVLVLIGTIIVGALWPEPARWDRVFKVRADLWLGAVYGLCIILGGMLVIPRLGAGPALGLILVGNLTLGLVIDHFGIYGVPRSPVTVTKVLGLLAVLGGFLMINRG